MTPPKKHALSDEDIAQIANATVDVLQSRRRMTAEQHSGDHEWVQLKIRQEQRREEMWSNVRQKIAENGSWAILVALTALLIATIKTWVSGN